MCIVKAKKDEDIAAVANLIYSSGAFSKFNWFRAFEVDHWKHIYQTASDNVALYISAKQKAEEV